MAIYGTPVRLEVNDPGSYGLVVRIAATATADLAEPGVVNLVTNLDIPLGAAVIGPSKASVATTTVQEPKKLIDGGFGAPDAAVNVVVVAAIGVERFMPRHTYAIVFVARELYPEAATVTEESGVLPMNLYPRYTLKSLVVSLTETSDVYPDVVGPTVGSSPVFCPHPVSRRTKSSSCNGKPVNDSVTSPVTDPTKEKSSGPYKDTPPPSVAANIRTPTRTRWRTCSCRLAGT